MKKSAAQWEKTATNREVNLVFVKITKACDTVSAQKCWPVMEYSQKFNTAIKQLYH